MPNLYQFSNLSKKLDDLDFPIVETSSGFQLVKVDFEKAYKAGNINFKDDGIYLEHQGQEYKGYMFIQKAYIANYGYPKFHLVCCEKIQEFIDEGKFKKRYEWSNSDINDILNMSDGKTHKDVKLNICEYCKKLLNNNIITTEDFFESLDKTVMNKEVWVDIYGYTKDWPTISRKYREVKENTCECCGVKVEQKDRGDYLHTHHKNGDKTNNHTTNLECLCILCHSYIDARHEANFSKDKQQRMIEKFVKEYGKYLIEHNSYIKKYNDNLSKEYESSRDNNSFLNDIDEEGEPF